MIWFNGQFYDSPYQVSVFDKINLGLGVFTTILAQRKVTGNIVLHSARAHYARLTQHAETIGLSVPYSEDALLAAAAHLIRKTDADQHFFAVRVQVTGGEGERGLAFPDKPTVFMTVSPVEHPDALKPVQIKIERDIRHLIADPMTRIKSNYVLRALARRKAVAEGFDDVLMMNDMNAVTSSSVGNVILRIDGVYKTPPLKDGVIDGTRRASILKAMDVKEVSVSATDFVYCEAAWIVNSLGIRSIAAVDGVAKPVQKLEVPDI